MFAQERAALKAASNRRSSEIAVTFASLRSRSTIANRLLISSRLVGSAFSHPYSAHFSKLIFIPDQKDLFAAHDTIQEMIAARQLCLELANRIDSGVEAASQQCFDLS